MKTNQYTPRRAGKRWLAGAPAHVLDLFYFKETGTWDALYIGPWLSPQSGRTFANCRIGGREMSAAPSHPQGVGMSFELSACDAVGYRYRNGRKRVTWDSLPEGVKVCILRDGKEDGGK